MQGPLRLGLTGGMGSGKSTVAHFFTKLGAAVIDADAISRRVTAPHGAAIAALAVEFGADFINSEHALDRDKMRALVYADASARKRLEAIVHPLVGHEIATQTAAAMHSYSRCIVFDIPLLVESSHWRQKLHQVLVLDCPEERQLERVMARSAMAESPMTREAVQGILRTQATRAQRLHAADVVIFNDAINLTQLEAQVTELWARFGLSSK